MEDTINYALVTPIPSPDQLKQRRLELVEKANRLLEKYRDPDPVAEALIDTLQKIVTIQEIERGRADG